MGTASSSVRSAIELARKARARLGGSDGNRLDVDEQIRLGYRALLARDPDEVGFATYKRRLDAGEIDVDTFLAEIAMSEEFVKRKVPSNLLHFSLHWSRSAFVKSLPPAKRILDLGGSWKWNRDGGLHALGYPYVAESVTIVDLPPDDRHESYRSDEVRETVRSPIGPLSYVYRSMTDLTCFDDESFDLVYSGQSIEHVRPDEAKVVVDEVRRLLAPGGVFALDTPNARLTRLQQEGFIDPDHKVEYQPRELDALLTDGGLRIIRRLGLNLARHSLEKGEFDGGDTASHGGVYWAADECYLLAYVCERPE